MCEYCDEPRSPIDEQGNFAAWMLFDAIVVNHSFGQSIIKINFCPMCGRELSDD